MATDADDVSVARGEDDVDGKLHEERVDRRTRRDDQGVAGRQRVAAKKPAPSAGGLERGFEATGKCQPGSRVDQTAGAVVTRVEQWTDERRRHNQIGRAGNDGIPSISCGG